MAKTDTKNKSALGETAFGIPVEELKRNATPEANATFRTLEKSLEAEFIGWSNDLRDVDAGAPEEIVLGYVRGWMKSTAEAVSACLRSYLNSEILFKDAVEDTKRFAYWFLGFGYSPPPGYCPRAIYPDRADYKRLGIQQPDCIKEFLKCSGKERFGKSHSIEDLHQEFKDVIDGTISRYVDKDAPLPFIDHRVLCDDPKVNIPYRYKLITKLKDEIEVQIANGNIYNNLAVGKEMINDHSDPDAIIFAVCERGLRSHQVVWESKNFRDAAKEAIKNDARLRLAQIMAASAAGYSFAVMKAAWRDGTPKRK